ncbi:MAG TPA: PAS domain-containing protein, partial [Verrucomicrobiae bacterium]
MAQVSSIRRKLISVIMLTTTCALVLAGASIIIYELVTLPKAAQSNFVSLAKVVADNSTAALAFNDPKVANDVLSTLNSYSTNFVKMAALYTTNGNLYAHYPASVSSNSFPSSVGPDRMTFERPFFTIVREVSEKGSRSGTLYFKGDLTPLYRRIWLYSEIVMLVLVGSGLVAFLLSSLLQKRISRPITSLVQTARIISEQRDYTVRAVKHDQDELGVLTDAFNHMLTQIQERTGALTEKEERLRLALQGSQTGTWDWNLETGKITWDEFTYRLFGRQPGEFDGTFKQFLSFIVPTERENVSTSTLRAIEEKREFALECRILLPGGETRYMSVRGKPFNGPGGKAVRVTGVALDVTESKRAEERIKNLNADLEIRVQARTAELTAANREMEAFTYSVAHDLRAPLRHVDGYTQMLQDELGTNLPGEAVEWAKRIRAATQNMGQLVDDLLNLARVGRQELVRRPANIKALVDEAIKTLQPEVNGRTVEWRVGSLPE